MPIYGKWEYVEQCLQSIRENTEEDIFDVFLCVNKHPDDKENEVKYFILNQSDKFAEMYGYQYKIPCIFNEENLGVSKSWNQGIQFYIENRLEHEYDSICFMNDDVIVFDGWLDHMRLVMTTTTPPIYCVQTQLTEGELTDECRQAFLNCKGSPKIRTVAPGLNGCLFMLSDYAVNDIGKFDEQFEIGFWEDADYLMRIRDRGQEPVVALRAYVHHYCGKTRDDIPGFNKYAAANLERFNQKWGLNIPTSLDTKSLPTIDMLRKMYGVRV